ncbi:energy transducer TonB [Alteromonas aestuariivivens]|uniref:energy transducer TonB n=1 Tax=Alteromonas aestuariivivens TaxID=1938339 RepID=UPI0015F2692A|nr:energy transducer TonB [Alteromonas aestuariivivens]
MKYLNLKVSSIGVASALISAVLGEGFTDVQIRFLETEGTPIWSREQLEPVRYPRALAFKSIAGCGIFRIIIDERGKTKEVSMISGMPAEGLELPAVEMIRSWTWVNTSGSQGDEETKLVRLDFCFGGRNEEEAKLLCEAQTQMSCSDPENYQTE